MSVTRKMIVAVAALEEKHRAAIAAAAAKRGFEVSFFESDADALPHLQDAEIIFSQSARLSQNAPRLRWQCTPSAGVNQFCAPGAFLSPDAVLTNSSGAYGVTIAEHAVMVTLEMLRREPAYRQIVSRREWTRNLAVRSIRDSRAALLGTGDIGRETAKRLRAFDPASVTGISRSGRNPDEALFDRVVPVSGMDAVLPECDLLILSLPGTPETFHLLNERRLGLLPDGALIVNVGRGTVIEEKALEKELRSGRLSAALDVFEREPLPADDPLWDCPNLHITPHTAGNMTLPYTRDRITALFLEDFDNYCAGRPLIRRADLTKGY